MKVESAGGYRVCRLAVGVEGLVVEHASHCPVRMVRSGCRATCLDIGVIGRMNKPVGRIRMDIQVQSRPLLVEVALEKQVSGREECPKLPPTPVLILCTKTTTKRNTISLHCSKVSSRDYVTN